MNAPATLSPRRSPMIGFSLLLALLALCAAAKVVLADTLDPDSFWHLRVADEISRQSWPAPLVDDLSFASIRTPWTPYSWLAELAMKRLWDLAGYRAAVAVTALLESSFILLLGLSAVETSRTAHGQPRYLASALAATMGGILSLAYLSFRPVTAAITLLALIAFLLLRDRRLNQKSKSVWLVPPLTALLINIHFYALLVPLWTAALLVGDVIESEQPRRRLRGLILLAASALACTATPMLRGLLTSVLDYSRSDVMVHSRAIAEMRPFYQGTMGHVSAVIVAILVFCLFRQLIEQRRQTAPPALALGELLWLAGSFVLLFSLGRFAPVFAIIAVPTLSATLPKLSDRILIRPAIVAGLATMLALIAWPIARGFPPASQTLSSFLNRNGPDVGGYPCAAADFVDRNIPAHTGRLICEFTWGGYLEWRLNPHFQTLMDGRTQLFSPKFWTTTSLGPRQAREQYLAATQADVAILGAKHDLFGELLIDLGWKTVYKDDYAQVLVPAGSKLEIAKPNEEAGLKPD
jgi:hypothetical protein